MSPPEALRDALGQVIAHERREWRRERELIEAQARMAIAELRAENVALYARLEEMVAARLATLRDGKDGIDGADGKDGAAGERGPQGERGERGEPGVVGADGAAGINGRDGADGAPGEPGPPGEVGRPGEVGPVGPAGADGAAGRDGKDGIDGAPGIPGEPGQAGEQGLPGRDGAPGERGPVGPAGRLPAVRAWEDRVHYEGDAITHAGSIYQAQRDTGREPPHSDWVCVVSAGQDGADGRSMTVRGTWNDAEVYRQLDVVALNGAAFVARRDLPGACPGEGWQMIAAQGKRGLPGEPGRHGPRGEVGPAGPAVIAMDVTDEGLVTMTNADQSSVSLDLYPLLSKIAG